MTKAEIVESVSDRLGGTDQPSNASPLYRKQFAHQVHWKEQVAGVTDCGSHNGQPRSYLFPPGRWEYNLLPTYRRDVLAHLSKHGIQRHDFAHHVMSSQVFALNLAAPFFRNPELLTPALGDAALDRVIRVEAEVIGDRNYLNEPGGRGVMRTSADLGMWVRMKNGGTHLSLIEVKFTERDFGECRMGAAHGGLCDHDGPAIVRSRGRLCPLSAPPHNRTYWHLIFRLDVFKESELLKSQSCPFRHGGYQLMRTQVLARAIEADPASGINRADFAALLHDDNEPIQGFQHPIAGSNRLQAGWKGVIQRPEKFVALDARRWVDQLGRNPQLAPWACAMKERYFPHPPAEDDAGVAVEPPSPPGRIATSRSKSQSAVLGSKAPAPDVASASAPMLALRAGHLKTLEWLASPEFAEVKRLYDRVVGPGVVYFRPTDKGVVMIMLDAGAPGYVGFRTSHDDNGYLLTPGRPAALDEAQLRDRYKAFRGWLRTARRHSYEEQAVIPWLRQALQNKLVLSGWPWLSDKWLFLNQEWRFRRDDGVGTKSDVIAVNARTGQLGIIEAKDSISKRAEAVAQVSEYGRYWQRDARELAPFFTRLLRTMGSLYGNPWAQTAIVSEAPAALFFAFPGASGDMKVKAVW